MTTQTLDIVGNENLPPFLTSLLDEKYKYHSHELTSKPNEDNTFDYKYTVIISRSPRRESIIRQPPKPCFTKCTMMIQVKFIFRHLNPWGDMTQTVFNEEFTSDTVVNDVLCYFRDICCQKMKLNTFQPRYSYCIGPVTKDSSMPLLPSQLKMEIAQLSPNGEYFGRLVVVANIEGSH